MGMRLYLNTTSDFQYATYQILVMYARPFYRLFWSRGIPTVSLWGNYFIVKKNGAYMRQAELLSELLEVKFLIADINGFNSI